MKLKIWPFANRQHIDPSPLKAEVTDSQKALRALLVLLLVGISGVATYGAQSAIGEDRLVTISIGILIFGGSSFIGGALGFLFGIPRTLQGEDPNKKGLPQDKAESSAVRTDYIANTNLEQISDWLTKILVGVGLTQIGKIGEIFENLSTFLAKGLSNHSSSQVFVSAILAYSMIVGFFFGYLWTRLYLAGAMRKADQAALGWLKAEVKAATEKAESTERKLDDLKLQSMRDAEALNLTYRQLNPGSDLPRVKQEDLNAAITAASRPIRVQVFNQAWQLRGANWREKNTKSIMELSIPIFRALIASDVENKFHANHGQLGFALKDKNNPDWADAKEELDIAIKIRGNWEDNGWLYYEFNRAICQINIDPNFREHRPTIDNDKEKILSDLRAAANSPPISQSIGISDTIRQWLEINGIALRDILR